MDALSISLALTCALQSSLEGQLSAFPPADVTNAFIAFNLKHDEWLRGQLGEAPFGPCRSWFLENCYRGLPWMLLQGAQDKNKSIIYRWEDFKALREKLGHDRFSPSEMPGPVPFHRFLKMPIGYKDGERRALR